MQLREWRQAERLTLKRAAERFDISLYRLHRLECRKIESIDLRLALKIEDSTGGKVRPRDLIR